MTATDRNAILSVLDTHRWKDMGINWCSCECGAILRGDSELIVFPADEVFRGHLADRILDLTWKPDGAA